MIKYAIKLYLWAENIWFKLPQKLRFLLVGGFNTVLAYSILALLLWLFGGIDDYLSTINPLLLPILHCLYNISSRLISLF